MNDGFCGAVTIVQSGTVQINGHPKEDIREDLSSITEGGAGPRSAATTLGNVEVGGVCGSLCGQCSKNRAVTNNAAPIAVSDPPPFRPGH